MKLTHLFLSGFIFLTLGNCYQPKDFLETVSKEDLLASLLLPDVINSPFGEPGPSPTFDLSPTGATPSSTTVDPDTPFTLDYSVINYGTGNISASFSVEFRLSADVSCNTSDTLIGSDSITTGVASGTTASRTGISVTATGVAAGSYYICVMADSSNDINETTGSNNNLAFGTITINPPGKDLTVSSVTPSLSAVNTDEPFTIDYTLANSGPNDLTPDFTVEIRLSFDTTCNTSDTLIGSDLVTADIASGGTINQTGVSVTASNISGGNYYLCVLGDSNQNVTESDESNNTLVTIATIAVTLLDRDLVPTAATPTPTAVARNSSFTVEYTIGNSGSVDVTADFSVEIRLSSDTFCDTNDTLVGSDTITATAPAGGSVTRSGITISTDNMWSGNYYLCIFADNTRVVTETSEGNNNKPFDIVYIYNTGKDLSVSSITPADPTITLGIGSTLDYSIVNNGPVDITNSFTVEIRLSTNDLCSSSDTLVGSETITDTIPGSGSLSRTGVPFTAQSLSGGDYFLCVLVDTNHSVSEDFESNNNITFGTINIVVGKDLEISTLTPSATFLYDGETLTVDYTIVNNGPVDVTKDFIVRFRFSTNSTCNDFDTLIGSDVITSTVPGNGSLDRTGVSVTPGSLSARTYYFCAIVDSLKVVPEDDESNNIFTFGTIDFLSGKDLTVTAVTPSTTAVTVDTPFTVDYTISNTGLYDITTDFTVDIRLSYDSYCSAIDILVGTDSVTATVPGNGTLNRTGIAIDPTGRPVESYYICVMVDVGDKVNEDNESNNNLALNTILIYSIGKDLAISTLTPSTTFLTSDVPFTVDYTLLNNGPVDVTGNFTVEFRLSTDINCNIFDTLIGSELITATVPGSGSLNRTGVSLTASGLDPKTYFLCSLVDSADSITEDSETNNNRVEGSVGLDLPASTVISVGGGYTGYSITSNDGILLEFPVTSGETYTVWWDDSWSGSGTYSLDVKTRIFSGDFWIQNTSYIDSGYNSGFTFTADQNGVVYIHVIPYSSGNTGTVGVKVTSP